MRKAGHVGRDFSEGNIKFSKNMVHEFFCKDFKLILILALVAVVLITPSLSPLRVLQAQQPNQVTITAIVAEPKERWDALFADALTKLRENHPDMTINIDYSVLPYADTRKQILTAMAGKTPIDLISVDQIWLGEFAEGGFLSDLTELTNSWNRSSEWYKTNWDGGIYNGKVYGIWAWTDVRTMWYWKDLLNQSSVNPESLKTWDGYLEAAKKIENSTKGKGIEAMHLVGASHSPDMWYPYLWMQGGEIVKQKSGHPEKGTYWFPSYNSTEGVKALEFLRDQVNAGIKPQINHFWGQEFADKKFAVMLEGSWLLGHFNSTEWNTLDKNVGMIPMFPVPKAGDTSATMMGGWMLGIPSTSSNKALSWELLTIMVQPDVLAPMLEKYAYLPTQKPIAEGQYSGQLANTIPYYKELISMLSLGHSRPSIAEYPQIADNIRQAIDEVYLGAKEPKQALDDAAKKSAEVLGWS
ncbi:MAG: extracellular solute-binding protein [Nitrososphaeraceae archaeon]|nr:extracellular solute-binding protein [Nitrososphaeraceae archaeon]